MPPEDQIFEIQTPSGHIVTIQAPDEATARMGAQHWHENNISLSGNLKAIPGGVGYGLAKGASEAGTKMAVGEGAYEASLGMPQLSEAMEAIPPGKEFQTFQEN